MIYNHVVGFFVMGYHMIKCHTFVTFSLLQHALLKMFKLPGSENG